MAGPSRGDDLSSLSHETVLTGTVIQKLWQAGSITPQCPLRCAEPKTEALFAVACELSSTALSAWQMGILTGTYAQIELIILRPVSEEQNLSSVEQLSCFPHSICK